MAQSIRYFVYVWYQNVCKNLRYTICIDLYTVLEIFSWKY